MDLTVQVRHETGKKAAKAFRSQGRVPAVLYGHGEKPLHLTVDHKEMVRLIREHRETGLVSLIVLDGDRNDRQMAIYKNVMSSTFRRQLQHVDFQAVRAGEKVNVKVAVRTTGLPEGVEKEGGVLAHVINELEIRVAADKIPEELVVDVSHLMIGQAVRVKDLKLEGIEVHQGLDSIVATVTHAAREIVATPAEGEVAAEGEAAAGAAAGAAPGAAPAAAGAAGKPGAAAGAPAKPGAAAAPAGKDAAKAPAKDAKAKK